jgi:2-polyprenyl-3-methyl-5-hydroxy-6-metoxy-1,4-benzoquinol methylase
VSSAAAVVDEPMFAPVPACWVCGSTTLTRFHECRFDFALYAEQDPGIHAYDRTGVWLARCGACGFAQPEALPTLPNYFDRMYDQRWSEDWVEREFDARYKDFIFGAILRQLERRVPQRAGERRRLLDVGAHAGRFMHIAAGAGWDVEGIELNPRTAACAARRTGRPVHQVNAHTLAGRSDRYAAITLTDVLEHIPEPVTLLTTLARLLAPGGVIAVKVPNGPAQCVKERALSAVNSGRPISLADNLVHVNHFSPGSLRIALQRAGFSGVTVKAGAPEMLALDGRTVRSACSNLVRLGVYGAASLPGGIRTPLALNLQAYAHV